MDENGHLAGTVTASDVLTEIERGPAAAEEGS